MLVITISYRDNYLGRKKSLSIRGWFIKHVRSERGYHDQLLHHYQSIHQTSTNNPTAMNFHQTPSQLNMWSSTSKSNSRSSHSLTRSLTTRMKTFTIITATNHCRQRATRRNSVNNVIYIYIYTLALSSVHSLLYRKCLHLRTNKTGYFLGLRKKKEKKRCVCIFLCIHSCTRVKEKVK